MILLVEDRLTLIDTGFRGSSSHLAKYITRLGRSIDELELIILTHNHIDHVGGLAELRRMVPVKVAAGVADLSESEHGLPYRQYMIRLMRLPPISFITPLVYVKPSDIDIPLVGNEVLNPLGGLRVIATPGHTMGSISLYSETKKLLVVGDTLIHRGREPQLPPKNLIINLPQTINSVKRLAQLDFDTMCFGHGQPLVGNAATRLQAWIYKRGL